jgi:toxin-antitoxin system PIN domain toxin
VSRYLLDVNILIALVDKRHVDHDRAHEWFASIADSEWLSCPITENGAVRVISTPSYPGGASSMPVAVASVRSITERGNHVFLEDRISLLNGNLIDAASLVSPKQLTDTYLLALAVHANAILATLDHRLTTVAVRTSKDSVLYLPKHGTTGP